MKNNKILMSLVLASISAMAAAPFVVDSFEGKDAPQDKDKDTVANVVEGKKIITVASADTSHALPADTKEEFGKQMDAMLMKKTSIQYLSESISILVDSYGKEDESMKTQIFKELNLAQTADSTYVIPGGVGTVTAGAATTSAPVVFCHNACHGACHTACHGARGWR